MTTTQTLTAAEAIEMAVADALAIARRVPAGTDVVIATTTDTQWQGLGLSAFYGDGSDAVGPELSTVFGPRPPEGSDFDDQAEGEAAWDVLDAWIESIRDWDRDAVAAIKRAILASDDLNWTEDPNYSGITITQVTQ